MKITIEVSDKEMHEANEVLAQTRVTFSGFTDENAIKAIFSFGLERAKEVMKPGKA